VQKHGLPRGGYLRIAFEPEEGPFSFFFFDGSSRQQLFDTEPKRLTTKLRFHCFAYQRYERHKKTIQETLSGIVTKLVVREHGLGMADMFATVGSVPLP